VTRWKIRSMEEQLDEGFQVGGENSARTADVHRAQGTPLNLFVDVGSPDRKAPGGLLDSDKQLTRVWVRPRLVPHGCNPMARTRSRARST
jgi:hypothetical protein